MTGAQKLSLCVDTRVLFCHIDVQKYVAAVSLPPGDVCALLGGPESIATLLVRRESLAKTVKWSAPVGTELLVITSTVRNKKAI